MKRMFVFITFSFILMNIAFAEKEIKVEYTLNNSEPYVYKKLISKDYPIIILSSSEYNEWRTYKPKTYKTFVRIIGNEDSFYNILSNELTRNGYKVAREMSEKNSYNSLFFVLKYEIVHFIEKNDVGIMFDFDFYNFQNNGMIGSASTTRCSYYVLKDDFDEYYQPIFSKCAKLMLLTSTIQKEIWSFD